MSREPEGIGSILKRVLRRKGWERKLKEYQAVNLWEVTAGEAISGHTRPLRCEDSKLFVQVESPSWRNELTFLKPRLIQKLNQSLGDKIVSDIIFVGGRFDG